MRFQEGMIVKSDAGHDQERYYVVVAVQEGFAFIADGKRRKLSKPKKKNVRHLKRTGRAVELTAVNTDPKLRRALRELNCALSGADAQTAE